MSRSMPIFDHMSFSAVANAWPPAEPCRVMIEIFAPYLPSTGTTTPAGMNAEPGPATAVVVIVWVPVPSLLTSMRPVGPPAWAWARVS